MIRLAVFEDVEVISEIELRAGELFRPVAFIIATTVDDCAHVMQVSVVPERRGERLGAALINQVESWATFQG